MSVRDRFQRCPLSKHTQHHSRIRQQPPKQVAIPTHSQPNAIATYRAFKTLCLGLTKTTKFLITDPAMRYLSASMVQTAETRALLSEALSAIFAALETKCAQKAKKQREVELEGVCQWLEPQPQLHQEEDEDVAPGDTTQLFGICRILNRIVVNRHVYYDVEWQPTRDPKENPPPKMDTAFGRQRRALVERTFIEYEAVEDNSLNDTEA